MPHGSSSAVPGQPDPFNGLPRNEPRGWTIRPEVELVKQRSHRTRDPQARKIPRSPAQGEWLVDPRPVEIDEPRVGPPGFREPDQDVLVAEVVMLDPGVMELANRPYDALEQREGPVVIGGWLEQADELISCVDRILFAHGQVMTLLQLAVVPTLEKADGTWGAHALFFEEPCDEPGTAGLAALEPVDPAAQARRSGEGFDGDRDSRGTGAGQQDASGEIADMVQDSRFGIGEPSAQIGQRLTQCRGVERLGDLAGQRADDDVAGLVQSNLARIFHRSAHFLQLIVRPVRSLRIPPGRSRRGHEADDTAGISFSVRLLTSAATPPIVPARTARELSTRQPGDDVQE
jgi:hypothetical protein